MRNKISKLKKELREIIEPDVKLLLGLQCRCALAVEKRKKILSFVIEHEKVDELLRWLVEEFQGDFKNVTMAFEEAEQNHIVNFIIADGGTTTDLFVFDGRLKCSV